MGHLAILFNCIYENPEEMFPMISKALYLKPIIAITNAPNLSIRICSKVVVSLLWVVMEDTTANYKDCLNLKLDEASRLIELLCIAMKEGEASEGLLTFSVIKLLISLTNLLSLSINRVTMIEKGIFQPLKPLITNEDYIIQKQSLQLVWTLLSEDSFSNFMAVDIDGRELCLMLQFVQQNPCVTLSLIAGNSLKKICWDSPEGKHYQFCIHDIVKL